jgi:hypothetical protein
MKNFFPKMPKLVVGLFAAAVISLLCIDFVPPRAKTTSAMQVAKQRILRYAKSHGMLPGNLEETEPIEGKIPGLLDGWGEALIYEIGPAGKVTLRSYGKDQKPGGEGAAADLIGTFQARQPNGEWAQESGEWTAEPAVLEAAEPDRKGASVQF